MVCLSAVVLCRKKNCVRIASVQQCSIQQWHNKTPQYADQKDDTIAICCSERQHYCYILYRKTTLLLYTVQKDNTIAIIYIVWKDNSIAIYCLERPHCCNTLLRKTTYCSERHNIFAKFCSERQFYCKILFRKTTYCLER